MGRMLIALVLGTGLLFSTINLNINRSGLGMVDNAVSAYNYDEARNNAGSGVEFAVKNLADDSSWTGVDDKPLYNGSVQIIVANTHSKYYQGTDSTYANARLITSIGKVGDRTDTIRAVIEIPNTAPTSAPPPFLDYAIASGGELELKGNVNIADDNNPNWNANIHTNSEFEMNGNNSIEGFLTYVSEAHSHPASRLNTAFQPNQNPNNDPTYNQVSPISIPSFDPDEFKSIATIQYLGNKTVNGNTTLGTLENPQIIYVEGNLTLSGNISGYGVFIVKGNITINGNVSINGQDANSSNMGLYTKGNLNVNGNVTLRAQVYAGGEVELNGNSTVYGSITAKSEVELKGNANVYYRPANAALTEQFWPAAQYYPPVPARPKIVSRY